MQLRYVFMAIAILFGLESMQSKETTYGGTIYAPFSCDIPSDDATPSGPRKAPVAMDESGWIAGPDAGQSDQTKDKSLPIGSAWILLLFALLFGAGKAFSTEITNLTISASSSRSGDTITVTPTVSSPPAGAFLCWSLYSDAACTHEISDVSFQISNTAANAVYFVAPEAGTYYVKAVLRSGRQCDAAVVTMEVNTGAVYPADADIILVRSHQNAAQQIDLSDAEGEKRLYGVMTFDRPTVTDGDLSAYQRYNYLISFPFDVCVGSIFGYGTYGQQWRISYYDGLGRAQNGYWADSEPNWKPITDTDSILHANQGYLLQLNTAYLAEDAAVWDQTDHPTLYFPSLTTASVVTRNETIPALGSAYECVLTGREVADSYWRCIGTPSMAACGTDDVPYLYQWDMTDNSLDVVSGASFVFLPMHAYLMQHSAPIVWADVKAPALAARRHTASAAQEYELELLQNGNTEDRTFIRMSDEEGVTEAFDFNYDLSKELNAGANIYSCVGNDRLAASCMPVMQKGTVAIGVRIASDGDYTFSLADKEYALYPTLWDRQTDTRTNLRMNDYTVSLSAGTYDERFVIEFTDAESPTEIENSRTDLQPDVRKVLKNGILYILRGGQIYDARGMQIY